MRLRQLDSEEEILFATNRTVWHSAKRFRADRGSHHDIMKGEAGVLAGLDVWARAVTGSELLSPFAHSSHNRWFNTIFPFTWDIWRNVRIHTRTSPAGLKRRRQPSTNYFQNAML